MKPFTDRINVASTGTKQQVSATSKKCVFVRFSADPANATTNPVFVGDSGVVAAAGATRRGVPLYPTSTDYQRGEGSVEYRGDRAQPDGPLDLADFWVDAVQNNGAVLVNALLL